MTILVLGDGKFFKTVRDALPSKAIELRCWIPHLRLIDSIRAYMIIE